jgi:hypothetical protein
VRGVCSVALAPKQSHLVTVRGAGGFLANGDGFALMDHTCGLTAPLPERGERWGQILLVSDSRTARQAAWYRFKDASEPLTSRVFQIVVQGELTCKVVERKNDSVTGHAFGSWGLAPCRLLIRSILEFHEVR